MNHIKFRTLFFLLAIFCVFVLGFIGYFEQFASDGDINVWAVLYSIFQMFIMEDSSPDNTLNWKILFARYVAAGLLGYGIFIFIYNYFKERIDFLRISIFYNKHTIICGLGEIGNRLATNILSANSIMGNNHQVPKEKLVVIESDPSNINIKNIRKQGGIVLIGSGFDINMFIRAGVKKAKRFVVVTGLDDENIKIANKVAGYYYTKKITNVIEGLLHIDDWDNLRVLKDYLDLYHETQYLDINTFNIYQSSAQIIYDTYPPLIFNKVKTPEQHILIIGYNKMAEAFLLENIILSHFDIQKKLTIWILDKNIDLILHKITNKYDFIAKYLSIEGIECKNENLNFKEVHQIIPQINRAYVFGDEDAKVLNMSKTLRQLFYTLNNDLLTTQIISCLPEKTLIPDLINVIPKPKEHFSGGQNGVSTQVNLYQSMKERLNIHCIRLFTDTCTKSHLVTHNEKAEILSRVINYYYSIKYEFPKLIKQLCSKENFPQVPKCIQEIENKILHLEFSTNEPLSEIEAATSNLLSTYFPEIKNISVFSIMSCWRPLSDRKKDSNRYLLRHLSIKLGIIGEEQFRKKSIGSQEEEFLLQLEHRRWCAEKQAFNFKAGALETDEIVNKFLKDELKVHDQLINFKDLDEKNKLKDKDTFTIIPLLLKVREILRESLK